MFSTVEIKGGVNYFLWSKNHSEKCKFISYKNNKKISESIRDLNQFEFLIRYNEAIFRKNKKFQY